MTYPLEWWRFAMILLRSLYQSYIKIVLEQVSILMHGKSLTLSPSTRKEISKLSTITDQSHFFIFLVKFFRKSNLIQFLNTFMRIVFFVITNQVFNPLIHVSINYFLLFMIFMHLLIVTHLKIWEGYFLIYLKPLIEWHEGLICKMKCIGITAMSLILLQNFLQNRHQWVLLNSQCSSWASVFAGCTTGFCIRPFVLSNLHKWLN